MCYYLRSVIVVLILQILLISYSQADGFYKVIGPRTIRSNHDYQLAISVCCTLEPVVITAFIEHTYLQSDVNVVEATTTVQPYTTNLMSLKIGSLGPGYYKLGVIGRGGVDLVEYYPLEFIRKSYSVFIQTDSGVYAPGSNILFWVIILNSELRPWSNNARSSSVEDDVDVFVSDGAGNRIQEWRAISTTRGVFRNSVKLSARPVLGIWNISVHVHGEMYHKTVEVAEFVLAAFNVNIRPSKTHSTFSERQISAVVTAHYNYGAPVRGRATVSVYPTIVSNVLQPIFQNPYRKVVDLDGIVAVSFDVKEELKLSDEYERSVILDVVVEEHENGRRQNHSVQVFLHKYNYTMDVISTADHFKPALGFTTYVKVSNHDGTPARIIGKDLTVRHSFTADDEATYAFSKYTVEGNGMVKVEVDTPAVVTNQTKLRIIAEYQNMRQRSALILPAVSASHNFLQISLSDITPTIGSRVDVFLNATENMRYIDYLIQCKGTVHVSSTMFVDNRRTFAFHFTVTEGMAPNCYLLASYIRDDGELIADAFNFKVKDFLQNFVEVKVSNPDVEPNSNVDFRIKSQPNSFIGLMLLDSTVTDLNDEFYMTERGVASNLEMYGVQLNHPFPLLMLDSKYSVFWKPGASDFQSTIINSGAEFLTNTRYHSFHRPANKPILDGSYEVNSVKPDTGPAVLLPSATRPPLEGPFAFSRIPKPFRNVPKVYVQKTVDNTWIFTNFTTDHNGRTSIRRSAPQNVHGWQTIAFSLNTAHGLGLMRSMEKIIIRTSQELAVNVVVPHSVQQSETVAVTVYVVNNLDSDQTVDVTLHNQEQMFDFIGAQTVSTSSMKLRTYKSARTH